MDAPRRNDFSCARVKGVRGAGGRTVNLGVVGIADPKVEQSAKEQGRDEEPSDWQTGLGEVPGDPRAGQADARRVAALR